MAYLETLGYLELLGIGMTYSIYIERETERETERERERQTERERQRDRERDREREIWMR